MKKLIILWVCIVVTGPLSAQEANLRNQKADGYKAIWFELNQKYPYGDKYSGALGTYTAKHIPLAIYAPEVDQTFFVYGGTTQENERHLLCMIGVYDHTTEKVSKPTIVYDKENVDDPHDNPTLSIDQEGFIWIFVSGRGRKRPGIVLKSEKPYSIAQFNIVEEFEFTYPQIWNTDTGFFLFFTKYTGVRELYFTTSTDKKHWSATQKLAGIPSGKDNKSGHYQVSSSYRQGEILGTFFNRHTNGDVDTRSDLYYVETRNFGEYWTSAGKQRTDLPLSAIQGNARVIDYHDQKKNVYLKDMTFDRFGNPVCLYITSGGHEPGPENGPYEWRVTFWTGTQWITKIVCTSDHNYDMGSIFIENDTWKIVGPTENGPQPYGVGGEIVIWSSLDAGFTWKKEKEITKNSTLNHSYIRRPLHYKAPFSFYWADGNPKELSMSRLYFGDFTGNVYQLPYYMTEAWEKPIKVY
ncbi:BNR-4 repeat-containing protein [Pareuzebyella sediminis]|uniref:BNR-4 repeat-containing protein n=1 Tax=Pareuzebyella sediminis TaxID=2607998 RepID=UPI0011ED0EA8|nr:BNR-4 repeat-containing protein [Pareuzebyella sediminis]